MTKTDLVANVFDERSVERIRFVRALSPGSHVHISGICGTGTAAALSLLKQLGFRVTGSDKAFYPPMGELVRKMADGVFEGYAAENLAETPALVLIGNALSRGNPEVEYVLENNIPFASLPEVFSALLIGSREDCRTSIVVTGTHGKTTTAAILASFLDFAGRKPGYFVGGIPTSLPSNIRPPSVEMPSARRVVVIEGDEYDSAFFAKYSKFHCYRPDIAIITSLEFDHADIYNSIEEIEAEFNCFVRGLPADGMVLYCDTSERLVSLAEQWRASPEVLASVIPYGLSEQSPYHLKKRSQWQYQDIPRPRYGQKLECSFGDHELVLRTMLTGEHNALNVLVSAAVSRRLGVGDEELGDAAKAFTGVKRRQQVIAEIGGITAIEDFAHHPSAVATTIAGLKESYPGRRLVVVYEPRSNTSRRAFFQDAYATAFNAADSVVIRDVLDPGTYSKTESEISSLDVAKLVADINAQNIPAIAFASVPEILEYLKSELGRGDVVVLMSNGSFDGLPQKLPEVLGGSG